MSKIDLAAEEYCKYHIDYWASLFKASTWDIKMLASKNEYLNEASMTTFQNSKLRLISPISKQTTPVPAFSPSTLFDELLAEGKNQ